MDSEQAGTDLAVPGSKSEDGQLQSGGEGEDTHLPKVKMIKHSMLSDVSFQYRVIV